jgi:hypothetical protein
MTESIIGLIKALIDVMKLLIVCLIAISPVLLIVGSSIWMGYDSKAKQISIDGKPYAMNNGALAWVLTGILLWIVTFPYYLYKRAKVLKGSTSPVSPAEQLLESLGGPVIKGSTPPIASGGVSAATTFCIMCGARLAKDAAFCMSCGKKQDSVVV